MSIRLKDAREKPGDEQEVLVEFSDEEGFGKYLDLHEAYNLFINLKGVEHIDYLTFLSSFDRLFEIPKERKNHEYKKYLNKVLDYVYGFLQRTKPLLDLEKELQEAGDDFAVKYDIGMFMGWPKEAGSALAHSGMIVLKINLNIKLIDTDIITDYQNLPEFLELFHFSNFMKA